MYKRDLSNADKLHIELWINGLQNGVYCKFWKGASELPMWGTDDIQTVRSYNEPLISLYLCDIMHTYNIDLLKFTSYWFHLFLQSKCPHGCPCDDYDCEEPITETTTTTPTTSPIDEPSFEIKELIDIKYGQKTGSIVEYYHNYEFSFELKISPDGLRNDSDLSVNVGKYDYPSIGNSLIYIFHGYWDGYNYFLWFGLNGTDQIEIGLDFEGFNDWHKAIIKLFDEILRWHHLIFFIKS